MSARIGRGMIMTLLLAGGCGSGAASTAGYQTGGAGAAEATGGVYGTATGAGGWAGASGGATSSAGAGGAGTAGTPAEGGRAGTTWLAPPPVPPALEPPAGATVKLHAHAIGAQIYTCTASSGTSSDGGAGATTYAWVFKAPEAKLYDEGGTQVGTHGAGPSWTWRDGSVANGMKVTENTPVAGSISWLLLRVTSTTGDGVLSDVTYVQRLNTAAGTAPATGCDATTAGTETHSPYSADYYFLSGGDQLATGVTVHGGLDFGEKRRSTTSGASGRGRATGARARRGSPPARRRGEPGAGDCTCSPAPRPRRR